MKLPLESLNSREGMRLLIDTLGEGQSRYVGGCVRDTLLGLPISDVDLATRLTPEQVMERLRPAGIRLVPTGIDHGTVTALTAGGPVELTTLRRDVSTDGRRATIAFTQDWREDAARRDFTINALSADPQSGELHDYFKGLADLQEGRVRFIGDPLTRIAEDHLRILRFFRFHARFGAEQADEAGLEACRARANDLMALSRERIADELLKLLGLPNPVPSIRLMLDNGILKPVVPEILSDGPSRMDALIAREQASGVAPEGLRRLAALLPPDPEGAAAVAARLRLSKKALKRLVSASSRSSSDPSEPRVLAYRIGTAEAIDRLLLGDEDTAADIAVLQSWEKPNLAVSGGDLVAMGLKAGPLVAKTLKAIEREWCARGFPGDVEGQRALARAYADQALREAQ
ncbi:MAG TPA: CCA tRNA nucleotidyltransferase [Allosphingosinicella sp.]|jgi:poly(A) polymerase